MQEAARRAASCIYPGKIVQALTSSRKQREEVFYNQNIYSPAGGIPRSRDMKTPRAEVLGVCDYNTIMFDEVIRWWESSRQPNNW